MSLSESRPDLGFRLALIRAPRVGPRGFKALVEYFGSAEQVFAASFDALSALRLGQETVRWIRNPDWKRVEEDLRWLETDGHHCLHPEDEAYPSVLLQIDDSPPLVFVRGAVGALQKQQLAVVGSRNPSPAGEKHALAFARALVETGLAVTSGLASGIDAAAHRGAIEGGGVTIAVAGTGLDQVYPRRNERLADAILGHGGALVSEFPTGTPPLAANFPRRNRIISGLSVGVLVVEAALRSGSLVTARMALEQGREVFAIPGSIDNPLARGCNSLIKQGAKLVESIDDILDEFAIERSPCKTAISPAQPGCDLDHECRSLLKYIAYAPTSVDTLVEATGETPEAIASTLLTLELNGAIVSADGGYIRMW